MLRNFAVLLMPILESKYRSVPLNCVQDLVMISWQGVSLYFAQNPVSSGGLVLVGSTHVEDVEVTKGIKVFHVGKSPQYSEWTVGPLSSAKFPPMFMQFTGRHQLV